METEETGQSISPSLYSSKSGVLQGTDSSRHANIISALFARCWEISGEACLGKLR